MINTKEIFAALVLFALFSASAEAKLYKWVDENGVTHYGETIPPEYTQREAQQLDKGRVTKKEIGGSAAKDRQPTESQETIEQKRRDETLLATYSNEQEIDLARDRNLQQIDARTNSIQMRLDSAQADLSALHKEEEGFTKTGKAVPASLKEDINRVENKVNNLQKELAESQNEATTLKTRYDADKKRYRELKGITAPDSK